MNNEHPTKTVELPLKESLTENCSIETENSKTKDNENCSLLNNCSMESNDEINKCCESKEQQNNENQFEIDLSENKQEEPLSPVIEQNSLSNKKTLRKNRRRRNHFYFSNKRRRKQKSKTNLNENKSSFDDNDEQFWMKKYSIESFSILIERYQLPFN